MTQPVPARDRAWTTFGAALAILLLLIPPHGALTSNEEYYFAVALQIFHPSALPHDTALFSGMPHTFLFSWVFGPIIDHFGFSAAQVVGRSAAIVLYALALTRLLRVVGLGAVEMALVLLAFAAAGQQLFGEEWMFFSVEPKVFAYVCVLFGIADFLAGKIERCFILLAVAAYCHFLVGGIWTAIVTVALILSGARGRALVTPILIYTLGIAPLMAYLLMAGYGSVHHSGEGAGPTAAWIYSNVAMTAHSMPRDPAKLIQWAPGIGATLALGIAALSAPSFTHVERSIARLVVAAAGFLLAVVIITYLDSSGTLAPFLVFRPTSLMLLLTLIAAASLLKSMAEPPRSWLRRTLLILMLATTVPGLVYSTVHSVRLQAFISSAQQGLVAHIRERTAPDSRFLFVEIPAEDSFHGFERRTGRALLVKRKFVPALGAELMEWYRRHEFRTSIRRHGCSPNAPYSPDYLLATLGKAKEITATCGPVVFEDGRLALIKYQPAAAPAALGQP